MDRTRTLSLRFAIGGLLLAASAAVSAAPAKLSAEQIVEKNVAARGGLAAWRGVQTLVTEGQMDAGGQPPHALPFVLKQKRPHKSRLEIVFKDQTAVQIYDGTSGWKVRPFTNRTEVEAMTAPELASAAASDSFEGPLVDYAAKGTKVSLVGIETIDEHDTYHLKLTPKTGAPRNVWIDAGNFLELRVDGEPRRVDGRMHPVYIYYRDWKAEKGLLTPRTQETVVDGTKMASKVTVTKVSINESLDDATFQKPNLPDAKPVKKP
jgi:outer membrane lipoprotein-sorting protein